MKELSIGGTLIWRDKEGYYHRKDGPAIIHISGAQWWMINGKIHREDGPAFIYANGKRCWYIDNKFIREEL